MRWILFTLLIFSFFLFQAQENVVISGIISDGESGETLIGSTIQVKELNRGTATNEYGFYSLTLPVSTEEYTLIFSYIGYQIIELTLVIDKDQKLDIEMMPNSVNLDEVVISADSYRETLRSTQMSVEAVSAKEAKVLPALFGEVDIIKTIQLKTGISSGTEGSAGLYVRGGAADQNLIVLDEALVYNANHLFGFFSTFNSDAIKDLTVYKGGFPSQYGGRLSSVIDVKLKEGNTKHFTGTGGIGLISSRLTLEGPIIKDKASFIVSGRRTYVDLITRQINKVNERNKEPDDFNPIPDYSFYDLNTKVNYQLGPKDRLFLSGYFGRDVFGFDSDLFEFNFNWGNATGTARWNHQFSPRLFANTTFTLSDYQYNISNEVTGFSFNLGSKINDSNFKTDLYYAANEKHTIRTGMSATYHQFTVGRLKAGSDNGDVSFSAGQEFDAWEYGLYAGDEFKPNARLSVNAGVRLSAFQNHGTGYMGVEPRAAIKYELTNRISLKGSYARMKQYIHLVANSGISLPTDVWYPSTELVKPQISDQTALGFNLLIGKHLLLTNEYYYKWLGNQVEFRDHASLFANDELEEEFVQGKGYAYGMELGLEKNTGKFTGWIAYTLALIRKGEFQGIMDGRYFSPRYDRRHDLSIVLMYDINKRLTVTSAFVYGSGDLAWLPDGRMVVQDVNGGLYKPIIPVYGDRNSFRLPAYNRLDLGLVINFFPKWGKNDLTISVYNAYDRRNPYFIYLEPNYVNLGTEEEPFEVPDGVVAKQVSLFPVLPSLTWNFKF